MESIKEKVFLTCDKLYTQYGIKKVTVKMLCETAMINRVAFYNFFKNKEDCFLQWWLRNMEIHYAQMNDIFSSDLSFKDKIDSYINLKKSHHNIACREYFEDLNKINPNQFPESQNKIEYIHQKIINFIISEKEKLGEKCFFSNEKILCLYKKTFNVFMSDREFSGLYKSVDEQVADLLYFFFYGVVG